MGSVIQRATGAFAPCQRGPCQLLRLEPRPRSTAVRITLAASAKYPARMRAGACLTMLAIAARRAWSGFAWLVPHQANRRIIEAVAKRLGLGLDRVIINLDRY